MTLWPEQELGDLGRRRQRVLAWLEPRGADVRAFLALPDDLRAAIRDGGARGLAERYGCGPAAGSGEAGA